jgi:hypothetical protein
LLIASRGCAEVVFAAADRMPSILSLHSPERDGGLGSASGDL